MTTLPKMVPHTAAKHLLLKRYLDRWFPILGKYNQRINYIDGFAGPGEYEGGEPGSPLLAIEAAKYHVERGTLYFVDEQKKEIWTKIAGDLESEIRLPIGKGLAGTVAETGEPVILPTELVIRSSTAPPPA